VDGLPLKRTNALGHTFAYAYDKARRLTVLTNENGETYPYGYDAAGQPVQQTEYGQSTDQGRLKDRPETWHRAVCFFVLVGLSINRNTLVGFGTNCGTNDRSQ